jgi:hypothetical protein
VINKTLRKHLGAQVRLSSYLPLCKSCPIPYVIMTQKRKVEQTRIDLIAPLALRSFPDADPDRSTEDLISGRFVTLTSKTKAQGNGDLCL